MGARREAREALAAAGLRPRKRWGQHFLCDPAVARRIVEAAELGAGSAVLEIGPGLGALTGELAARARRLYLVEIDPGLVERLRASHGDDPRVRIVEGDVLTLPLAEIVTESGVTVVANLPYNVATPVLFRLLDLRARFPRAVVMLQREMALRLAARPGGGDYGVTSVLMQAFATIRIAFGVSRRSFMPRPDVDSAVLDIRWSAEPRVDLGDVDLFRAVVRAAFGQRRKMLRNALAALVAGRGRTAEAVFAQAGIAPTARAETLDLAAFARLARAIE
ncbi:MAG TPA: 16S rRNA (adenine(1518)-N(6)/adenine(1519)-N(6))-dimethyltransferase RsmA [Candidatus Binatus sp.]|nr:16S rRNA (adenine(1518)-N(6)/adenine(1519)-N(6))-dimethyltransferase RsmA [Candidatus Binatus sp.]